MVGNITQLQLPPPPPDFPYFSLTFQMYDKIKLIDCEQQCLERIRRIVASNWILKKRNAYSEGIQSQRYDNGTFEIKLSGHPFMQLSNKAEALASKRLCCALLISLHSAGWELCVSSDLSQTTDLTTWFFQKNSMLIGRQLPADGGIICLSLSSTDKLQLVNAPEFLHDELLQCAGPLLQSQEVHGPDLEVKLIGYPWMSASFEEGVAARQLLLDTIRKFDSHKYRFYGTANLKGTADCIFFEQDRNYIGGDTHYCILSLNLRNRILLIDCPQAVIYAVGRCITQYWPGGVQDTRLYDHCVEYKLMGYPWYSFGDDAIESGLLFTHILESLVSVGWAVMSALDISRRPNDKAVFVLRSCTPASVAHLCICPSDENLIRLINAPKDVQNAVAGVIHSNWPNGIKRERIRLMAYEWKLKGYPWSSDGGIDYAMSRHLMTRLLNEMARMGWRVICSADVSSQYVSDENRLDHSLDVHSWFLACTGHVAQPPGAAGPSFSVGLVTPLAPSSEMFPPPPSYDEIAIGIAIGFASPPAPSSEAFPPPPSYSEVMNE